MTNGPDLAPAIGRAVTEWIGKTPDTPVPDRVKARVFLAYGGRCYLSGRKITPADKWEVEHKLALGLGGENRESNLAPAIVDKHKTKTADDTRRMRKADRQQKAFLGLKKTSGRGLRGPGFNKSLTKGFDGQVRPRTSRPGDPRP